MEAREARFLSEFLKSDGPQYVIPVYQRNYTWDSKNVFRLLDDIHRLLKGESKYHFIGNIVFVRKSESLYHEREIVDGQQRVTTIFLILLALRDLALESADEDNANAIESLYLFNKVTGKYSDFKNKLKPNIGDGTSLQILLDRDSVSLRGSKSAIYKNYCNIKSEIKKWITEEGFCIEDCLEALDSLMIVWVALSANDNAQQIFESINSTGEPLTASDLIRNFILMNKSDDEQTEIYNKYWTKIENNIYPDHESIPRKKVTQKIEEFFRFFIMAQVEDLVKKDQVYLDFKEFWLRSIECSSEEEILTSMVKFSRYWYALFKDENPPSELQNTIFIHRTIDSNMPAPFLLSAYKLYEEGVISISAFKQSISLINTYLIRRHMCGLDTSSITRMFPTLFKNVWKKCQEIGFDSFVEVLKHYLVNAHKNNAMFMPNNEQISTYLASANAYTLKQTKVFFTILESETLDTGLYTSIKNNPIPIDVSALTVEHIMPQEATDYWRNLVDDRSKYEHYVNLIGNLTLADKKNNTRMSNRDFEYKKNALRSVGRINMNVDIISSDTWNSQAIIQRTAKLTEKFIDIFPYFESKLNLSTAECIAEEYRITLNRGEISASAIIHLDKTVDILSGSTIRKCSNRNYRFEQKLRQEIEKENITDRGDVFYVEEDICGLTSISAATDFIYGGSNNGWIFWEDENGIILNDSLRTILEK